MTPERLVELKEHLEDSELTIEESVECLDEIQRLTAENARLEKVLIDEQLCEQCGGDTRPTPSSALTKALEIVEAMRGIKGFGKYMAWILEGAPSRDEGAEAAKKFVHVMKLAQDFEALRASPGGEGEMLPENQARHGRPAGTAEDLERWLEQTNGPATHKSPAPEKDIDITNR